MTTPAPPTPAGPPVALTNNVKDARRLVWDQRNRSSSRHSICIRAGPHRFYNDFMLSNHQSHLLSGLELPPYRDKDESIREILEQEMHALRNKWSADLQPLDEETADSAIVRMPTELRRTRRSAMIKLAPPLGERLNPNGEGIVRVYVSPSCTDLTKEELSGGEAGLGIPFDYTPTTFNFCSPGPHFVIFELDKEYSINRVEAAGCNFSYSIKHVKWQTAPAKLGPWVTFVKTRLNPDEKESSITDVNALSASARYLRLEVVDNGSLPNKASEWFAINNVGIYASPAIEHDTVPLSVEQLGREEEESDEENDEDGKGKGRGGGSFKKFKKLSPRSKYIESCANKLLLPEPLGLNHAGSKRTVDLSDYGMGDAFADCLAMASSATGLLRQLETLILRNNKLSDTPLNHLLMTLSASAEGALYKLDLSSNLLTFAAAPGLQEALKRCKILRELNLESNFLGDKGIISICDALRDNKTVRILRLGDNQIKAEGTHAIARVLSDNSTLTHLGLERNEIGMACRVMASGLQANQTLEALDLSRNTLGGEMKWDNDDWQDLAEALAKHKSLTHLDLSYNGLRREECMMLGKDLEANHVCIGLHLVGNACHVNSQGFVVVAPDRMLDIMTPAITSSTVRPMITGTLKLDHVTPHRELRKPSIKEFSMHTRVPLFGQIEGHSHHARILDYPVDHEAAHEHHGSMCWMCGNWTEVKFEWIRGVSGERARHDIVLHLEIDDFVKSPLKKSASGESYVLYRMLPPGVCRYFFTADGNPTPLIARDHPISSNVTNLEIRNCFTKELALNCVAVKPLHKAALARNCVVRPGQRHLTIAPIDNVWSLNSSVFGPRMIDADTSSYWEMPPLFFILLQDEWSKAKMEKHYRIHITMLNEYRQHLMQGGFTTVFHIFRQYSLAYPLSVGSLGWGTAVGGEVMTWGSDALEHFLDDVGARNMVDERTLKLILGRTMNGLGTKAGTAAPVASNDDPMKLTVRPGGIMSPTIMGASVQSGPGSAVHGTAVAPPPTAILLYQLLAFLFGLCVEVCNSPRSTEEEGTAAPGVVEVLNRVFAAARFEAGDAYRNCRLYRQEVDALLRQHYADLDRRFKKYATDGTLMTLQQLTQLLTDERVLASRLLSPSDIRHAFVMSIITKRSLYGNGAQTWRLRFIDFLEVICRVADMLYGDYRNRFRWPRDCTCANMSGSRHGLCDPCMGVYSSGPPLRTSLARLLRQHLIFLPADAFLLAKNLARYFDSCHNRIHQSTEGGSSELLKKFQPSILMLPRTWISLPMDNH